MREVSSLLIDERRSGPLLATSCTSALPLLPLRLAGSHHAEIASCISDTNHVVNSWLSRHKICVFSLISVTGQDALSAFTAFTRKNAVQARDDPLAAGKG